ncbi:MAG: hypothetical protein ACTSWW_01040 [Promethearchaeota archaeon]
MAKQRRKEIYILDQGGQMVHYFSPSQNEDDNSKLLTASYLTGILSFAKAASGNLISSFELGKIKIMLKVGIKLPLFYVFIVGNDTKLKEKKIDQILTQIIADFEEMISLEELKDWTGDLTAFDQFIPTIKKILKVK